eukprot:CAMPEP_0171063258 /NCGR_PEP_ID=MMETSP0766_2-20121228/5537_1 /TAXON_ID=439317 /ORGANISM="Gambierdiscus australes, Strain CAWD 149" /LENGTH=594 /DNA_ID=CAMNT_0011519131 /DNA_START=71 /DNA_END=1858 /DNA_ORIENTATION=+
MAPIIEEPPEADQEGAAKTWKFYRGTILEVHCCTTGAWVPAEVREPEQDGKVVVEFAVGEEIHRKSMRRDSQELRLPQEGGRSFGPDPSEAIAVKRLGDLQAKEERLTSVGEPPERATAAAKWIHARKVAQEGRSLELWGCANEKLNGIYVYEANEVQAVGQPVYVQRDSDPARWLYVSKDGTWCVGDAEARDQRQHKCWMRSDAIKPGHLPHVVDFWEAPKNGVWNPLAARFWLSESADVAWQQMRVAAYQAPVVEVRGATDTSVDGFYDFVAEENSAGEPPVFQHQQRPDTWLFLAHDQRWWIGCTAAKEAKENRGVMHCATVQPGTHPAEATNWQYLKSKGLFEECKALKIRASTRELRAREKWVSSQKRAQALQIWGKELHGEYVLKAFEDGVPVYQHADDEDFWLYVSSDGSWWVSDGENKEAKQARGFMRSGLVEPGTLPQDVCSWEEWRSGAWQSSSMVSILTREAATKAWEKAWDVVLEAQVVEIQGVAGPRFNGMYDLLDMSNSWESPVFQHQVNQDLFLYVAVDGRWWMGSAEAAHHRAANGRMHSELIRPGMLPDHADVTWHVYNRTSKEWEQQDSVQVKFAP